MSDTISNDEAFGSISAASGTSTITFVGGTTPASMPATFVNNTTLLTIEASVVTGKTVTGTGDLTVTALNATDDADLSGITTSGTNTVQFTANTVFTGKFPAEATTITSDDTNDKNALLFVKETFVHFPPGRFKIRGAVKASGGGIFGMGTLAAYSPKDNCRMILPQ